MPSPMAATDLITSSLRLIGAIATGETPTASELNDGLNTLNDLLELMSTQNLFMYGSADVSFPTVAGTAPYTIGPTGTWVGDRPIRINDRPFCTYQGVDFPVEVIGQADYDLIPLKTQSQPIVERMLFINDSPNGRITLWPVPSGIVTITMNIDRILTNIAALATTMTFPPGYLLYMRHELGVMLAPDYGRTISPEIAATLMSSKAAIKRANKVRRTSNFDAALVDSGPATWQTGVGV